MMTLSTRTIASPPDAPERMALGTTDHERVESVAMAYALSCIAVSETIGTQL